jgi:hypothetical protein
MTEKVYVVRTNLPLVITGLCVCSFLIGFILGGI